MPSAQAAEASPLASAIFAIGGISGVFFGPDFISVTKSSGEWQYLKPAILGVIMEHFTSGAPILSHGAGGEPAQDEYFAPEDAEIVAKVKELLETRVRPAVAGDGGDIVFRGFKDGVVYLQDERRLFRLPVLDRDPQARRPEPDLPFRAGSHLGRADLSAWMGLARERKRRA